MYLINTELKKKQTVFLALTNIFGINLSTSKKICKHLGFSVYMRIEDLNKSQSRSILDLINKLNITTSYDLSKRINLNKKLLIEIKCYRGIRLNSKLPVRGQRTHTNSKTCKKHR